MVPERINWAVGQLDVKRSDRVLEIGCGSGHAVALLCRRANVTAIDRSALQVARARERAGDCARIERLTLAEAPDALGTFDTILAINVNAFWTEPAENLASAARLLKRPGRLYLVYEPPSAAKARFLEIELPRLFATHGFRAVDVRSTQFRAAPGVCVVGVTSPHR